jgi:cytochrome oxidase Cu insertion factor (SCO1/SenC/PrrC family)
MSESSNRPLHPNKTSGRKILLILAVIFVLPFTIAKTMHLLNVHPTSHSYGTLVNPPQALQLATLHDTQGKDFSAPQWKKIWSIVMVDSTGCAAPCQKQVHLLKQVQTSLDKDAHRVQRVLLVPTLLKLKAFEGLQKQYPDLIILAGADAETVKLAGQFNIAAGGVYLVDPLGNLMMSYPPSLNPKGLYSDLKRLLKNSWAG